MGAHKRSLDASLRHWYASLFTVSLDASPACPQQSLGDFHPARRRGGLRLLKQNQQAQGERFAAVQEPPLPLGSAAGDQ